MRKLFWWCAVSVLGLVLGAAPPGRAQVAGFDVEIVRPTPDAVLPSSQTSIEVEGRTSAITAVRQVDLFLVLDTSKSLRRSDPKDNRSAGAIALVKSLYWSNTYIGVVDFDRKAKMVAPLTGDRTAVIEAIRGLDQDGSTDLAAGIRTALQGFEKSARPGSSRVMILFTDGKSKPKDALEAMAKARAQAVSISTVVFGSDAEGAATLHEIADRTGGSFVAVTDPSQLPDAFLNLRTTGVERVELRVNGSAPVPARLVNGTFTADVPLASGENRIVAAAHSVDGRQKEVAISVTVRSPGCAGLQVRAERAGAPALSISDRAVEIVVDASGSMWGKMDGRTKIEIAREILEGALDWLPPDLNLSLRAYGHRYERQANNCEDTELLVPPGAGNRSEIRSAIAGLRPKGQTPLGYALSQVAADFGSFRGERAVVLVTDGIESCGGDAPAAARALQADGRIPVHVIGFGLGGESGEDLSSLRAIAEASGGRFITAGSAAELRRALGTTVGTPFRVWSGNAVVARGTIGAEEPILLPAGEYRLQLDSTPPFELPVSLGAEEGLTLVLRRDDAEVVPSPSRAPLGYTACADTVGDPPSADGAAPGAPEAAR